MAASRNSDVVPLDRSFVSVSEHPRDDSVFGNLRAAANAVTWTTLSGHSCVVVLGEAGIGKTVELRERVASIVRSGGVAFFVPVEELAAQGVQKALARDPNFRPWRDTSSDDAWFMLDAVDESVLKGRTLSHALNSFCDELDSALSRVRLVVSSRASDWRSTDEGELRALAQRLATPSSKDAERFALVQLAPLNESHISALCAHWGMGDVTDFLHAVRDSNAWSFLDRPLDVAWMSRYWNTHHRLGSLQDLIKFNIHERLKEKPGRQTVISHQEALDGASTLSLVAALSQQNAFLLPGEERDPRAIDALDPRDVLSDWRNEKIQDLLGRSLFDEATYGRVRVHHRSVHEYLAALRLARLLDDGCPRRDIEALFFRESSGHKVIPRHLTAILAWLALLDPEIRQLATRDAPEHLVDEGDPSGLPVDERRNILRTYVDRFGDRDRVFHHFDSLGLQRFATVELSSTIRELLTAPGEPDHIRELLLRIIRRGRLSMLADVAAGVALEPSSSTGVRIAAIRAACDAGDNSTRTRLKALLETTAARSPEIAAALLEGLFPTVLTVSDTTTLLQQVSPRPHLTVTSLDVLVRQLPQKCSPNERRELLTGLLRLLRSPESKPGHPELDARGAWLADSVTELLRAIVEDDGEYPECLPEALELLREAMYHPLSVPVRGLSEVLEQHPNLRRHLFWRTIEGLRNERGAKAATYWDAQAAGADLRLQDLSWLGEDARDKPHVRDRVLAFDCFWHLAHKEITDEAARHSLLLDTAEQSDTSHGDGALARKLSRKQNPPAPRVVAALVHMRLDNLVRSLRKTRRQEENRQTLTALLPELRAGTHFGALHHLFGRFQMVDRGSRSLSQIADAYGPAIAEASMQGLKAFWKLNAPARVEDFEPNRIPHSASMGLLGIDLDVAEGLELLELPSELQRFAIGYAPWELNTFPGWLHEVARSRGPLVCDVLAPVMRRDYVTSGLGRVLPKLDGAPEETRRACAPVLVELLTGADPPDLQVLKNVLNALDGLDAIDRSEMTELAERRSLAAATDPTRFAVWWCHWLTLDAMPALDAFEAALARHPTPRDLAEETFSRLWTISEPRWGKNNVALKSNRDVLVRLIPIVHAHIHPSADIHHDGEYTVERRDHCQELRDVLIPWLSTIDGTPTVQALEKFAAEPWLKNDAAWVHHLAEMRATDDVTERPFSVAEAVRFVRSRVLEPATTAELFTIALNRLDDIRLHLANDDFSVRAVYNPNKGRVEEEHVQHLLAQMLQERRRNQYTVTREPEVTRKKKPDIRLANPQCEGPVTLEVKIAERWTLAELEESLRGQLVGTYMKDNASRYGALVLCSSGPRKRWRHVPTGNELDFPLLLEHLGALAADIDRANSAISGLQVVGLDFH